MPLPYDPRYGPHHHGFRFPETPVQRILKYIALIIFGLVFIIGLLVAIFKAPSESKSESKSGDKASGDKPADANQPKDNANTQPNEQRLMNPR